MITRDANSRAIPPRYRYGHFGVTLLGTLLPKIVTKKPLVFEGMPIWGATFGHLLPGTIPENLMIT